MGLSQMDPTFSMQGGQKHNTFYHKMYPAQMGGTGYATKSFADGGYAHYFRADGGYFLKPLLRWGVSH